MRVHHVSILTIGSANRAGVPRYRHRAHASRDIFQKSMPHWKLTLAYDGTDFHGWQVQPGLPTVQGSLARAIAHVTGETVLPQGSGRTDTGVHALGQVASFSLAAPIPPANLLRALNRALPPSIRVLRAVHVDPEFHARHSALRKTYEYRIFPRVPAARDQPDNICPPFLAPYAWDCPWHIDLARAQQAAALVIGEHDFTSFAATDPEVRAGERAEPRSAVRRIFCSRWQEENGLAVYRVTGSGFLHHMVRNLVGTFVDAATGRIAADAIPGILEARDRSAAGQTAPACGLFLVSVEYGGDL
jgi:tRNA pseudouridine38-40 synthase